jgi:hypothetical protein
VWRRYEVANQGETADLATPLSFLLSRAQIAHGMAWLTLDLVQVDEQGNITESCFKTFGCGSAIASSSVATEWYANVSDGCSCLLHLLWIACRH